MAKKPEYPAADDWSDSLCENALDIGFFPSSDDEDFDESTWVAGAVHRSEPSAPLTGYFLPFDTASWCLGWFRWWVLPGCCVEEGFEGEDFMPSDVKLEGEYARVAEVIDKSEQGQAEAILYYLAEHSESISGGSVLPAEKDPFKSVVKDLLDFYPLDISYLIPLSDLLGECGTDADAWKNLLGVPVKFSGERIVLPKRGWRKVTRLVLDMLNQGEGSVNCIVRPLAAYMDPDSTSDKVLGWLDTQRPSPKPKPKAKAKKGGTYWGDACRNATTIKAVKRLLKPGVDIDARDEFGKTPLMEAAKYNKNPKITEFLIKSGADVNACDSLDRTALHYAVGVDWSPQGGNRGDPEVTKTLLKAGANTEARDGFGNTPLLCAVSLDAPLKVISVLLEAGADVDDGRENGETPLMCAAKEHLSIQAMALLLKAGADIEAWTDRGQTPLIWLAEHADTVFYPLSSNQLLWRFKSLLRAGANAEAKDNDGKTAWDYAKHNSELGNTKAFEKLLTLTSK